MGGYPPRFALQRHLSHNVGQHKRKSFHPLIKEKQMPRKKTTLTPLVLTVDSTYDKVLLIRPRLPLI